MIHSLYKGRESASSLNYDMRLNGSQRKKKKNSDKQTSIVNHPEKCSPAMLFIHSSLPNVVTVAPKRTQQVFDGRKCMDLWILNWNHKQIHSLVVFVCHNSDHAR